MRDQNRSVLDDDRIGRLLLKLSLPAFMGMLAMTLYNVVDTIFIGHYIGYLGIAGLSIVFPIQMLAVGLGQMMGMGGASLVSRSIGAHNVPRAEKALGNAITGLIGAALMTTMTGLINIDFWLRLLGSSDTILPYARDYMKIILIGMFFQAFSMTLNTLIRAEGNARVPMTGMIVSASLNIILDAIFIISLEMGIKGAALATVIAEAVSVAYFLRYYLYGNSYLKIHLKNLMLDARILREIVAIGIASFVRTIAGSMSAVFVNKMIILYGGDYAFSAFGIALRIMMFAMMPGIVIGQGLQPILGFNYGAKRYGMALKAIKIATIAATAFGLMAFIVLYFTPEPFIRIFTPDEKLISLGSYTAKQIFLAIYLIGFIMVSSLVFQSIGKAAQSFITSISRPVFLVPLLFAMAKFLRLDGILLSFPLSDAFTFILTVILIVPEIRAFRRLAYQRI